MEFSVLIFPIFLVLFFLPNQDGLGALAQISLLPSSAIEVSFQSSKWLPDNSGPVFNVMSFGAAGDGVRDDTHAVKMAWDAACKVESATVFLPNQHAFMMQATTFTGPCKSGLVFQIDGTLMTPDGPDSWANEEDKQQWLVFQNLDGLSMKGGGLIDGRGEKWWNLPCKPRKGRERTKDPPRCDSPIAIRFLQISNLMVQGLKFQNSPQFHIRFDSCRTVYADSISIKAPATSPNTDGIHVENSTDVKIYNSIISNGDDCVSIGAGSYNIDIKNITCDSGHGISIGSLGIHKTRACVSNVAVTDSVIKHSDNGVRIKTWQGGTGAVSKVSYNNIHMEMVRNPIIIDQYYCYSKNCPNHTNAVFISEISYANIKGSYDNTRPAIRLACSNSVPCTNLVLSNVELNPAQGEVVFPPFCWNAFGAQKTPVLPPLPCLFGGNQPSILQNDVSKC